MYGEEQNPNLYSREFQLRSVKMVDWWRFGGQGLQIDHSKDDLDVDEQWEEDAGYSLEYVEGLVGELGDGGGFAAPDINGEEYH